METDVTQEQSIKNAIAATVAEYGTLNVLLNCAGGSAVDDLTVHEMELEVFQRALTFNLVNPFLCCRYGIPHMIAAGGGSIVNVTSHTALMGSVRPAYAAAKGGVISFTKILAAQYAEYGIRANAVAPGTIRSGRIIERYENKEWQQANKTAAAARVASQKLYPFSFGEPSDIAAVALFLASDESRMLTGTTIAAEGGRSSYLKIYASGEE